MKTTTSCMLWVCASVSAIHAQKQYSHGNPTADEQYLLELINRARSNPAAEGLRLANTTDRDVKFAVDFFGVDVARLKKDFASYPARPPLAMNPQLLAAARRHSNDMARKNFQSHTGSDGSTIGSRIADAGFRSASISENIYSNLVSSTFLVHAGLTIDWGRGPGGVQPGLGHRTNVMGLGNSTYREVGIGVVARSGEASDRYGKLAVTQDYGTESNSVFFLLGVAYQDDNRNGICDPGEGMSGTGP
ncbi:MAG: CAP domain-containing protein, partial [Verrucomicrobiaceae bacterium]